jgi:hypothetical protein
VLYIAACLFLCCFCAANIAASFVLNRLHHQTVAV